MFKNISINIIDNEGFTEFTASLENHHSQIRLKIPYNLEEFEAASDLFIKRAKELTNKVNSNV